MIAVECCDDVVGLLQVCSRCQVCFAQACGVQVLQESLTAHACFRLFELDLALVVYGLRRTSFCAAVTKFLEHHDTRHLEASASTESVLR